MEKIKSVLQALLLSAVIICAVVGLLVLSFLFYKPLAIVFLVLLWLGTASAIFYKKLP